MATDPEAQTQLARLLGDESLRAAGPEALHAAVEKHFQRLVHGLVAETAASDDVFDKESALTFVRLRLETLQGVLTESQGSRLLRAARGKIEAW